MCSAGTLVDDESVLRHFMGLSFIAQPHSKMSLHYFRCPPLPLPPCIAADTRN